jgi:hypothetical protein
MPLQSTQNQNGRRGRYNSGDYVIGKRRRWARPRTSPASRTDRHARKHETPSNLGDVGRGGDSGFWVTRHAPRGTATALTIPAQPLPSRPLKTQGTNNTAPGAKPGRRRTKHGLSSQRMSSPHHPQKKPKLSASSSPTGEPTRTSTMRRSLAALAACAWPSAMRTAWEAPFQSFRQDLPGPSVRVISSNNPRAHYS